MVAMTEPGQMGSQCKNRPPGTTSGQSGNPHRTSRFTTASPLAPQQGRWGGFPGGPDCAHCRPITSGATWTIIPIPSATASSLSARNPG